jgi:hypothetical protein
LAREFGYKLDIEQIWAPKLGRVVKQSHLGDAISGEECEDLFAVLLKECCVGVVECRGHARQDIPLANFVK